MWNCFRVQKVKQHFSFGLVTEKFVMKNSSPLVIPGQTTQLILCLLYKSVTNRGSLSHSWKHSYNINFKIPTSDYSNSTQNRNIEGHVLLCFKGKSYLLWVSNKVSQMIYDPNCPEILMILGHLWISIEF